MRNRVLVDVKKLHDFVKRQNSVSGLYVEKQGGGFAPIRDTAAKNMKDCVELTFNNGVKRKVAHTHRFQSIDGSEVFAIDAKTIRTRNGTLDIVNKVDIGQHDVFDIMIDDPHWYIDQHDIINHQTGKTTFLINMAEAYMAMGLNVLYFTLEVSENVIRERTDVCIFDMNFDEVQALEKIQYLNRINTLRNKTSGELIIREFASGSIHVGHIRHVVNELKTKRGIKPDVIIVDYLTLLLSSLMHPSAKSDSNTYFTSVAEELRGLMKELECVGWTATQFNRGGQDKDDVGMSDTGLSIGIQATSDFSVAFMSPEELAKIGKALGKVLKNRYANKQTIGKFLIGLDNDKQAFFDLDEEEQKQVMENSELDALKSIKSQSIPKGTVMAPIQKEIALKKPTNPFGDFNFGNDSPS